MPGCGKSTVGVVLAKILGYQFLDSDLLIQSQEKRILSEIIREEGLDRFLLIEEEVNAGISAEGTVIATGGSVIYGKKAMEHLKKTGIVVYLKYPLQDITVRLGDLTDRGVALQPGQTLEDLYAERIPLYELYADVTVEGDGFSISETAAEIRRILKETGADV